MISRGLFAQSVLAAKIVTILGVVSILISTVNRIVLARLLEPEVFGMYAFALIVIDFCRQFTNIQSQKGIIREKKEVKKYTNIYFLIEGVLTTIIAFIILLFAPIFLKALGKSELTLYVRVLSITLFLRWFAMPLVLLEKELDFKRIGKLSITSIIIGSISTILLASLGFGIWSLIIGSFISSIVHKVILWMIIDYRPQFFFDREIAVGIIKFGLPLSLSGLFGFWYWNIDDFLVGRLLGNIQLGYYWFAFTIPHYILRFVEGLDRVTYPAFSKANSDGELQKGFALSTKFSAIVLFLPAIIAVLWGKEIIRYLFGEKWLPATLPFQIFMCLVVFRGTFRHWANIAILRGHTPLFLQLVALSSVLVTASGYFLTVKYGITGTAIAVSVSMIGISPIYILKFKKMLSVSYIAILWRIFLISGITLLIGRFLKIFLAFFPLNAFVFCIVAIIAIYVFLIFLIDRSAFLFIIKSLNPKFTE